MPTHKLFRLTATIIAAAAATALVTSTASASTKTFVVCNQWNACWKVKERIATYPADVHIVYQDDTWWSKHEHDAQWRELPDPSDDHGWYDKDGVWRPFAAPPQP